MEEEIKIVTVDHIINIQRIVDNMLLDSVIFDSGATVGKLRSVEFGDPPNMLDSSKAMPYAYVTTDSNLQETSYDFGTANSDSLGSVTVRYKITVIAQARDKQVNSQKQLYNLIRDIRSFFEGNPTQFDADSPPDNPIFSRSVINKASWKNETRGKLVTVISFILDATIGENLVLTIPGFGDLTIISDSGDDGRNNTQIANDEGNTKRSKGAFVGVRFFEYEYSTDTFESLEDLIVADNTLDLVIKYISGDITYPAKLEYQRQSERFDGIRTVFLQANRETA